MKRLLPLILLIAAFSATAKVPASVTRAVKQANDAAAMEIQCTINGAPASLTMSGECFIMDLGDAQVYYDGTTQWAYNAADSEVTIIEPTDEELAATNPLRILQRLETDYDGSALPGKPDTVRLTPTDADNTDIAEVTATFSSATGWPTSLTIITASGRAGITNLSFTVASTKTPVSVFKFKAPKGTTITDLR